MFIFYKLETVEKPVRIIEQQLCSFSFFWLRVFAGCVFGLRAPEFAGASRYCGGVRVRGLFDLDDATDLVLVES